MDSEKGCNCFVLAACRRIVEEEKVYIYNNIMTQNYNTTDIIT